MTRRVIPSFPVLLVAPILVLGVSCSSLAVAAATVNGVKITESEVESELDVVRADPVFGEAVRRDPQTRGERRREILTELIRQAVADQEARKLRVDVTQSQIDQLIEGSARGRGMSVDELLEQESLSRAEANRLAERNVRRFALVERVIEDVEVDPDRVREVYDGQQDAFVEVHLERITVADAAEAREVLEELNTAPFADVARERSSDALAEQGGDMGYVPITHLDVDVRAAIDEIREGGLTDPIEGAEGFEVYRLVDRRTTPFEEVEEEIARSLTQDERDQLFDRWLSDRVREADIVVNPKYGRFDAGAERPAVVPSGEGLGR